MSALQMEIEAKAMIADLEAACLDECLTMSEVMGLYHKAHKTIEQAIEEGRVVARQARFGRVWLISRRSCEERWGHK
jgi:hypothetical protein